MTLIFPNEHRFYFNVFRESVEVFYPSLTQRSPVFLACLNLVVKTFLLLYCCLIIASLHHFIDEFLHNIRQHSTPAKVISGHHCLLVKNLGNW